MYRVLQYLFFNISPLISEYVCTTQLYSGKLCNACCFLLTANKVEDNSESECVDDKEACVMWAKHGYCESRPDVMNVKCRKSCRICSKSLLLRVLYNKQTH